MKKAEGTIGQPRFSCFPLHTSVHKNPSRSDHLEQVARGSCNAPYCLEDTRFPKDACAYIAIYLGPQATPLGPKFIQACPQTGQAFATCKLNPKPSSLTATGLRSGSPLHLPSGFSPTCRTLHGPLHPRRSAQNQGPMPIAAAVRAP